MNIDKLTELLAIPFDELTKENKEEITEFYKEIYKVKGCSSCKNKFNDYYQKLQKDGISKLETSKNSLFKIKQSVGVIQLDFGVGEFISFNNSPDELCIEFLRTNPNRISMFESFPENWKELINNEKEENDGE